ncbi:hypothetical protein NG827_00695 [Xanthomonas sacchari]|uniref:hypothetical protein n=1 Tax=Xanthomonas TaxID=338 RepID=UPI0011E87F48|nr:MULTISPECIES: hypothetical protein [Xanthomonas]MDQ7761615.1 hypothetical protein [Xanthomonas sontii]UYK84979.1 hypothetical protein NG827_00695 [Xanthomonas sacchari]UZK05419.1 hypothetical protein CJ027_000750 [Xanthomonas sontii]
MSKDEIQQLHEKVVDRLDAANIKYIDSCDFDDMLSVDLTVQFPCGRATRNIFIWDEDDLEDFDKLKFESFTLLGSFAAIADRKSGQIEAILTAPGQSKPVFRKGALLKALGLSESNGKLSSRILIGDELELPSVSFGPTTKTAKLLSQSTDNLGASLFIKTPGQITHDSALDLLERLSNSVFFGIDVGTGAHFALLRHAPSRRRSRTNQQDAPIEYPKHEYDKAPMALYWYARSAEGMPLLQFLAYYQVIEYYYPVYYNADMSRRIRSILKHPSFRVDRDVDLSRVIAAFRGSRQGPASERDQLRATLKECLSREDIKAFLGDDKERAAHFLTKSKGVTGCLINPDNRQNDLAYQVAERIYDIRCKIVHTKGDSDDGDIELLLPYSPEADRMHFEIDLARFIAHHVLIASSRRLEIAT